MKRIIAAIVLCAFANACQTTKYVSEGGDFRFSKPFPGEKVVRSVHRDIGESYFLFGAIPAVDQRPLEDLVSLKDNESLANLQIENKITGTDFLIMIGLCVITACISSIVWTKRTTLITGDIVVDEVQPAH